MDHRRWLGVGVLCGVLSLSAALGADAQGLGPGVWQLAEIDGQPFEAPATLEIGADGRISGQGPCNQWFARGEGQEGRLFGLIGSTKMACDALAAEQMFLDALAQVTTALVEGDRLTLTGPDHRLGLIQSRP